MVKTKIISVGKIKQRYYLDIINDYIKRLSSTYKVEHIIVDSAVYPNKLNPSILEQICLIEGENILRRIDERDYVICLNLNKNSMDSIEFNEYLNKIINEGNSSLIFIIGGSYGLGQNILNRANYQLTLSKMTLIHEMAIIFILEQIYRSVSIDKNSPYHK